MPDTSLLSPVTVPLGGGLILDQDDLAYLRVQQSNYKTLSHLLMVDIVGLVAQLSGIAIRLTVVTLYLELRYLTTVLLQPQET